MLPGPCLLMFPQHLLICLGLLRDHGSLQRHYRSTDHTQGIQVSWKPVFPRLLLIQFLALGLTVLFSELRDPRDGGSWFHSCPLHMPCLLLQQLWLPQNGCSKGRMWVQVPVLRREPFPWQGSDFIAEKLWNHLFYYILFAFSNLQSDIKPKSIDLISNTRDPRFIAMVTGHSYPSKGSTI